MMIRIRYDVSVRRTHHLIRLSFLKSNPGMVSLKKQHCLVCDKHALSDDSPFDLVK